MNVLGVEERIIGASVNKPEQFSQTRFPAIFFVVSIGILPFFQTELHGAVPEYRAVCPFRPVFVPFSKMFFIAVKYCFSSWFS
jgi:hypothetical protein